MDGITPMLKQYQQIKAKNQDAILFFRLGDFYEMFLEDAKKASGILDLVLTSRDAGKAGRIPMCRHTLSRRGGVYLKINQGRFESRYLRTG